MTPHEIATRILEGEISFESGALNELARAYLRAEEALRRIADHSGEGIAGELDEWTEAAAFAYCQDIARAALAAEPEVK